MTPLVVFPDAALVCVTYLHAELAQRADEATVGTRVPNPRGRAVLCRRLGGLRQTTVTDAAQIAVECWAATEKEAEDLAQLVRGLLHAMRGTVQDGVTVYRVAEFSGPQLLPDPLSSTPRVVFSVQVFLRGTTP